MVKFYKPQLKYPCDNCNEPRLPHTLRITKRNNMVVSYRCGCGCLWNKVYLLEVYSLPQGELMMLQVTLDK